MNQIFQGYLSPLSVLLEWENISRLGHQRTREEDLNWLDKGSIIIVVDKNEYCILQSHAIDDLCSGLWGTLIKGKYTVSNTAWSFSIKLLALPWGAKFWGPSPHPHFRTRPRSKAVWIRYYLALFSPDPTMFLSLTFYHFPSREGSMGVYKNVSIPLLWATLQASFPWPHPPGR